MHRMQQQKWIFFPPIFMNCLQVVFLSKYFDNIQVFRIQIVLKIENNPFIFKIHPQRLLTNLKNSVFNLK